MWYLGVPCGDTRGVLRWPCIGLCLLWGHASIIFIYDNAKIAAARILGDRMRIPTRWFIELQSHYLLDDKFG